MEIQNFFSFDILIQGVFLTLCFSTGVYILFKDNLEKSQSGDIHDLTDFIYRIFQSYLNNFFGIKSILNGKDTSQKKSKKKKKYRNTQKKALVRLLFILPLFVIVSFSSGVLGYAITDQWMDSDQQNHLLLKRLWIPQKLHNHDQELIATAKKDQNHDTLHRRVKDLIRFKAFSDIHNYKVTYPYEKHVKQAYYHAKHEIILVPEFSKQIKRHEILIDYCQSFAFGFFLLFIFSAMNLILMITRVLALEVKQLWNSVFGKHKQAVIPSNLGNVKTKNSKPTKSSAITYLVIFILNTITACAIYIFIKPNFSNIEGSDFVRFITIFIVYFGCLTFLLFIIKGFRKMQFSFFWYSLIYIISIIGYMGSSKAWVFNTEMVAYSSFGIQKSLHISDSLDEIQLLKDRSLIEFEPLKNRP